MTKWLTKFLENRSEKCTDNTDRFSSKMNMSVLSVHPEGAFHKNLENEPKKSTDSTDRFNSETNMFELSLHDNFDERIAIAEYGGHQAPIHAERIAYLDAFLTFLFDLTDSDPQKEWLIQKVQVAREHLETLHLPTQA